MKFNIVGHSGTGKTLLTNKLSNLYPEHYFREVGVADEVENDCDGVIVLVNLTDGPMPGTRLGIEKCKKAKVKIVGFCFTHLDEFDAQTKYGPHIKELVEIEARELASTYGFDNDEIPSIRLTLLDNSKKYIQSFMENVFNYVR
jgi:translation elongation factor EF-Tu-like GTPase